MYAFATAMSYAFFFVVPFFFAFSSFTLATLGGFKERRGGGGGGTGSGAVRVNGGSSPCCNIGRAVMQ